MGRTARCILLTLAVALMGGGLLHSRGAANRQARAKARYYYMQGADHQANQRLAEAFEMYSKAREADPTYEEAAAQIGGLCPALAADKDYTAGMAAAMKLLENYVDLYPGDVDEALFYAKMSELTGNLDEALRIYRRTAGLYPKRTEVLVKMAELYTAMDSVDSAQKTYDQFEVQEGPSGNLLFRRLALELSRPDTVAAVQLALEARAAHPADPVYGLLLGSLYEQIEMPDSALAAYEQTERDFPQAGMPKLMLAEFYQARGDSARYDAKVYDVLMSEDIDLDEKGELLAGYISALAAPRDSTAAEPDFSRSDILMETLRDQYPFEPEVLAFGSEYCAIKGDYKGAIENIRYALDLNRAEKDYWVKLISYYKLDDQDGRALDAVQDAKRAIGMSTDISYLLIAVAANNSVSERMIPALREMIGEYVAESPDTINADKEARNGMNFETINAVSDLYCALGDEYYRTQAPQNAFVSYQNSLFYNPLNYLTMNNYAYYLSLEGQELDKARELAEAAVKSAPDNDTYIDTYAYVLFKLGDYDKALTQQKRALEIATEADDVGADLLDHYGDILYMAGDREQAREQWRQALELDPDNSLIKKKVKTGAYHEK